MTDIDFATMSEDDRAAFVAQAMQDKAIAMLTILAGMAGDFQALFPQAKLSDYSAALGDATQAINFWKSFLNS